MSILVFAESSNGQFKKSTFEAVSYAKAIADSLGTSLSAVSIGNVSNEELNSLGNYGVSKVFNINNAAVATFSGPVYASAIAAVAKASASTLVVMSQTYSGRAIAPRVSIKLDAALFSGVNSMIEKEGAGYKVVRSAYSLKAIQTLSTDKSNLVVTLKGNAYKLVESSTSVSIEGFDFTPSGRDLAITPKEIKKASSTISLTEADTVVSAGRGLKGPENWGMIEELATLLGAATACSKPVADVHWRPHHEHVGQTGIQVSPNVYIAVGISGAIQHLAGVSSSKTIIVINKDAEAPFFKIADYGIVGDAFEVVPNLLKAVKEFKSKQ